ncbi:MAG: PQQ-binding-like beta-propeller repeat protein [Verrucomicrobiaceae bacterium]|nr:PQQ-binding-like beta-propeller repeat protein [Verrucomicrobiaceae bacterium]
MKLLCLAATLTLSATLSAADWPHWRGISRTGITDEKVSTTWPSDGPKRLWSGNVGVGFSGFAVAGGKAITIGNTDDKDVVTAFDVSSGKVAWTFEYDAELDPKYFEGGPTSSPTIHEGHVYILGRQGQFHKLALDTGKAVWSVNLAEETGARVPDWGFTGSPFILRDKIILNVGSHGTCVELGSGKVVWKSAEEPAAGYSTPLPLADGTLAFSNSDEYFALDAASGKVKWTHAWATRYGVNAADPVIVSPTELVIATGYNKGSTRIDISAAPTPKMVWQNRNLRSQMNPALFISGMLFGVDGDESSKPAVNCVDALSGEVKWTEKSVGAATMIGVDGGKQIVLLSDKGELHVLKATSESFDSLASAQVLSGRCWTAPVLANGCLLLRNAAGEVVALDMKP